MRFRKSRSRLRIPPDVREVRLLLLLNFLRTPSRKSAFVDGIARNVHKPFRQRGAPVIRKLEALRLEIRARLLNASVVNELTSRLEHEQVIEQGEGESRWCMNRGDDRATLLCKLLQDAADFICHPRVQPRCWLVEKQDPGPCNEGERNVHALSLATRNATLEWVPDDCVSTLFQPEGFDHIATTCSLDLLGHGPWQLQLSGVGKHLTNGELIHQRIELLHVAAEALKGAAAGGRTSVEHLPRKLSGTVLAPRQDVHESRLAAATRAHERRHLPRAEMAAQALEDGQLRLLHLHTVLQVFEGHVKAAAWTLHLGHSHGSENPYQAATCGASLRESG
mmetsp:Transcript_38096/g.83065  ORF Transcript_38096/g.83065 Transcript_38096/m.83065 type:complete len:336 (+) Transcript_38096:1-1008(+)